MKVAIIGSRTLQLTTAQLKAVLPADTTEIVSGGAKGVDTCARMYAEENGIRYIEFLPDYKRFGRGAPLRRNVEIVDYADLVLAFWDGVSRGTKQVIDTCSKRNVPVRIFQSGDL